MKFFFFSGSRLHQKPPAAQKKCLAATNPLDFLGSDSICSLSRGAVPREPACFIHFFITLVYHFLEGTRTKPVLFPLQGQHTVAERRFPMEGLSSMVSIGEPSNKDGIGLMFIPLPRAFSCWTGDWTHSRNYNQHLLDAIRRCRQWRGSCGFRSHYCAPNYFIPDKVLEFLCHKKHT